MAQYTVDKSWYRAQVIGLPGGTQVQVRYVDFGNVEIVQHWSLKHIIDQFVQIPVLVRTCARTSTICLASADSELFFRSGVTKVPMVQVSCGVSDVERIIFFSQQTFCVKFEFSTLFLLVTTLEVKALFDHSFSRFECAEAKTSKPVVASPSGASLRAGGRGAARRSGGVERPGERPGIEMTVSKCAQTLHSQDFRSLVADALAAKLEFTPSCFSFPVTSEGESPQRCCEFCCGPVSCFFAACSVLLTGDGDHEKLLRKGGRPPRQRYVLLFQELRSGHGLLQRSHAALHVLKRLTGNK